MTIRGILLAVALVLFILSALGVGSRVKLDSLGWALVTLTMLF